MQKDDWVGSREGDNFSYTKGEMPIYGMDCKNSLILSDLRRGQIEGMSNHAFIKKNGKKYLIPIAEFDEILGISKNLFGKEKIFYKKPDSIIERENLEELNEEQLKQNIFKNYGIFIETVNEIKTKKGSRRVYELSSEEGIKFMLKYHGKNLGLFKAQVSLLEGIPTFSKIVSTRNSNSHILFWDSIYYLEEFVEGDSSPLDKERYFNLVGKHLASIHNEFDKKRFSINNLEGILNEEGNVLSESNLISMQIDLGNHFGNDFFLREISSFYNYLYSMRDSLHIQIIHGDLNKSNLIWKRNKPTIIDFETISSSKRIEEFPPALLFEGNLSVPKYNFGSLKELLDSYNFYSNQKLSECEKVILPDFLKFSLIKSYVIYVIRRNLKNEKFKNNIADSLKILGEEANVY